MNHFLTNINESTYLFLHLGSCLMMVGVIWVIQLIHYPSFAYADKNQFSNLMNMHTRSISFIVVPLMLVEIYSGIILLLIHVDQVIWILNFFALATIWLTTFFVSVPCHNKLAYGFDLPTIRKLVSTNWIRTALWTGRAVLILCAYFN